MTTNIRRRNIWLILSFVLGLGYTIFLVTYFIVLATEQDGPNANPWAGTVIAIMLPHAVVLVAALILNVIAVFRNAAVLALIAAIVYLVSGLLFVPFGWALIPSIAMSAVAFAQLRKPKIML